MVGVDPAFGNWLAGFIDGEGCFYLRFDPRRPSSFGAGLKVGLTEADAAILYEVAARTGLGRVRHDDWHHRQRPTNRPTVVWEVCAKAECAGLVEVLDRFPLRARKAGEYAVWRQAVLAWQDAGEPAGGRIGRRGGRARYDWQRCAALKRELDRLRDH